LLITVYHNIYKDRKFDPFAKTIFSPQRRKERKVFYFIKQVVTFASLRL
jgi:hypothetical protein